MKYRFNINNLDCANCAKKIEDALNKDKNITAATVNFASLKLTVETNIKKDTLDYIKQIVNRVEPDVIIYTNEVKEEKITNDIIRLVIGILLGITGVILKNNIIIIVSYIILLIKTFLKAFKLLKNEKTLNENFLITISCVGAYLIDKKEEGLMVIILYEIGKILEKAAVNNSRKSISNLVNIKPEYANIKKDNDIVKANPEDVNVGDVIIIKPYEKIPLDGIIVEGSTKLNTSALTGESILRKANIGDAVLSGMINEDKIIEVKVTANYENSTVSKILELLSSATDKKAKTETFVSKMAKIYTPIVFILAILVTLYGLIFTNDFYAWLYKALVFLVISCPCAIAISVPLSYFAAIGKSSKEGILIKGSNYLDNLKNINKIIFDKTGTLTTGTFSNIKIDILDDNYTKEEIEKIIVSGEALSSHPIAVSIVDLINVKSNLKVNNYKEYKGKGIKYEIDDKKILLGNYKFCNTKDNNSLCYLNINDNLVAQISITDKIKEDAKNTIEYLKKQNILCEMFTGDSKNNAFAVANKIGIEKVNYELLPQDKYSLLEKYLENKKEVIAFVGDGINDSLSLAICNIGISMGGIGSSAAIESSDVVIMDDKLLKILTAIKISKYTNKIIKQNLIFAISTKILVLLLSIMGIASMWQAVFADVGVTLITIFNTTRILSHKFDKK